MPVTTSYNVVEIDERSPPERMRRSHLVNLLRGRGVVVSEMVTKDELLSMLRANGAPSGEEIAAAARVPGIIPEKAPEPPAPDPEEPELSPRDLRFRELMSMRYLNFSSAALKAGVKRPEGARHPPRTPEVIAAILDAEFGEET